MPEPPGRNRPVTWPWPLETTWVPRAPGSIRTRGRSNPTADRPDDGAPADPAWLRPGRPALGALFGCKRFLRLSGEGHGINTSRRGGLRVLVLGCFGTVYRVQENLLWGRVGGKRPLRSSPSQGRKTPAFPRDSLDWCTRSCIILQGGLVCSGWILIHKSPRQSRCVAWHRGSFCFKIHRCHLIALPAGATDTCALSTMLIALAYLLAMLPTTIKVVVMSGNLYESSGVPEICRLGPCFTLKSRANFKVKNRTAASCIHTQELAVETRT